MIEEALIETLRPAIEEIVRAEVKRAEFEWQWRSAEQAAELLGITVAAVRQRVQAGTLPGCNDHGRVYVDLRAFDQQLRADDRATVGGLPVQKSRATQRVRPRL